MMPMLIANQIKILLIVILTFIFLIDPFLALLVFIQDRPSFIAIVIFEFLHFYVQFLLFLFILMLIYQAQLVFLTRAIF